MLYKKYSFNLFFFVLIEIILVTTLWSQTNSIIQLSETLKPNLVAIKADFSNSGDITGFGFITGQDNGKIYVATVAHIVRDHFSFDDSTLKSVKVRFYNDYLWSEAKLISFWEKENLALLEVIKPNSIEWKVDCADFAPDKYSTVHFIGLNLAEQRWIDVGIDGKIFDLNGNELFFAITTLHPGIAGAPLITNKGIAGLIIEDERSISKALTLNRIQELFRNLNQNSYFMLTPQPSENIVVENLRQNVVAITVKFFDSTEKLGFGFITGEKNEQLYLITAGHILHERGGKSPKSIHVKFYSSLSSFSANEIKWFEGDDLSLLTLPKPKDISWKQKSASFSPQKYQTVRFIGKNEEWLTPGFGEIFRIENSRIDFTMNSIEPGTSGAPLLNENGIIGIILEDEGTSSFALSLDRIKELIGNSRYPYFSIETYSPRE